MKLPFVELDIVTKTLTAFVVNASATELVAMVSVVGYEESVIDSEVEKFKGAAWARRDRHKPNTIKTTSIAPKRIHLQLIVSCLIEII